MSTPVQRKRWAHARKRAFKHHNLDISACQLQAMVHHIEASANTHTLTVVHLERLTNTTELVALFWKDRWLPVVYQKAMRQIKTILPANELERRQFSPPRPATPEEEIEDFLRDRTPRRVVFEAVRL